MPGDDVRTWSGQAAQMESQRHAEVEHRVVVEGELGDRFELLFPGMRLTRDHGTTVLTGPLRDQVALVGIIAQVQDLGLELISFGPVHAVDGPGPGPDGRDVPG